MSVLPAALVLLLTGTGSLPLSSRSPLLMAACKA